MKFNNLNGEEDEFEVRENKSKMFRVEMDRKRRGASSLGQVWSLEGKGEEEGEGEDDDDDDDEKGSRKNCIGSGSLLNDYNNQEIALMGLNEFRKGNKLDGEEDNELSLKLKLSLSSPILTDIAEGLSGKRRRGRGRGRMRRREEGEGEVIDEKRNNGSGDRLMMKSINGGSCSDRDEDREKFKGNLDRREQVQVIKFVPSINEETKEKEGKGDDDDKCYNDHELRKVRLRNENLRGDKRKEQETRSRLEVETGTTTTTTTDTLKSIGENSRKFCITSSSSSSSPSIGKNKSDTKRECFNVNNERVSCQVREQRDNNDNYNYNDDDDDDEPERELNKILLNVKSFRKGEEEEEKKKTSGIGQQVDDAKSQLLDSTQLIDSISRREKLDKDKRESSCVVERKLDRATSELFLCARSSSSEAALIELDNNNREIIDNNDHCSISSPREVECKSSEFNDNTDQYRDSERNSNDPLNGLKFNDSIQFQAEIHRLNGNNNKNDYLGSKSIMMKLDESEQREQSFIDKTDGQRQAQQLKHKLKHKPKRDQFQCQTQTIEDKLMDVISFNDDDDNDNRGEQMTDICWKKKENEAKQLNARGNISSSYSINNNQHVNWRKALQQLTNHSTSSGSYKVAQIEQEQAQDNIVSSMEQTNDRNNMDSLSQLELRDRMNLLNESGQEQQEQLQLQLQLQHESCHSRTSDIDQENVNNKTMKINNNVNLVMESKRIARFPRPGRSPASLRQQTNARLMRHKQKIVEQNENQSQSQKQQPRQNNLDQANNLVDRQRNSNRFRPYPQSSSSSNHNQHQHQHRQLNAQNLHPQSCNSDIARTREIVSQLRPSSRLRQTHPRTNSNSNSNSNIINGQGRSSLSRQEGYQQASSSSSSSSTVIQICDDINQLARSSQGNSRLTGQVNNHLTSNNNNNNNVILFNSINMLRNGYNSNELNKKGKRIDNLVDKQFEEDNETICSDNSSILDPDRPFCKICHIGSSKNGDKLISPCKCSGTMRYIHCACLLKWLEMSNCSNEKPMSCELCGHEYTWHKKFNYKQMQLPKCSSKDIIYHTIFILALGSMIFCALAPMFYKGPNKTTSSDPQAQQQQSRLLEAPNRIVQKHSSQSSHHNSGSYHYMANSRLAQDEKFMLFCAASFFISFFLAIYVQTKARDTLYSVFVKFLSQNQTYYITEYNHGQSSSHNGDSSSQRNIENTNNISDYNISSSNNNININQRVTDSSNESNIIHSNINSPRLIDPRTNNHHVIDDETRLVITQQPYIHIQDDLRVQQVVVPESNHQNHRNERKGSLVKSQG